MKWMKLISVGGLNAIGVFIAFILVGNLLQSLTGQYIDGMNLSSVVTCALCLALLIGSAIVESKRLGLALWAVLVASVCVTTVAGIGLAVGVAVIAGGIG